MSMADSLWFFGLRSLATEYGWAFLARVVLRHPVRTLRGLRSYARGEGGAPLAPDDESWKGGRGSLVGVGFCLKPLDPPCPAGRANHDCLYFERALHAGTEPPPAACSACAIREIGLRALGAGADLYVMTSARDILHDLFLPALERERFAAGLFTLCRYSFEPFRLALRVCDLPAQLIDFASGDCRDFAAWRRADLGVKEEQTGLAPGSLRALSRTLERAALERAPQAFERRGNLYEVRA